MEASPEMGMVRFQRSRAAIRDGSVTPLSRGSYR